MKSATTYEIPAEDRQDSRDKISFPFQDDFYKKIITHIVDMCYTQLCNVEKAIKTFTTQKLKFTS
jgi:hypothetical protein